MSGYNFVEPFPTSLVFVWSTLFEAKGKCWNDMAYFNCLGVGKMGVDRHRGIARRLVKLVNTALVLLLAWTGY